MALSGTVTGPTSGYRPKLRIDWSASQSIPSNNSSVTAIVYLVAPYNVVFSASKSGSVTINGNRKSFSTSRSFSGTGTWEIARHTVKVGHSGDGTKSFSYSASYDIAITFGGSSLPNISASSTGALNTIPRASSVTKFDNFSVQSGTAGSFGLTISRHTTFTHDISLVMNGETIQSWNGQGLPTVLSYNSTSANRMLNLMRNTTSSTVALRVQTKSGSTNIGGAVSRNATASVHGNQVPSVSAPTVSIHGTGRDKAINRYVQGISKADVSASGTAPYGARLKSSSITVRVKTGGANRHVIGSLSGTTGTLTHGDLYTATSSYTDTRGRTVTASTDFTVEAYSGPKISSFRAVRDKSTPTYADMNTVFVHSNMGTSNPATFRVDRRVGTGDWFNVRNLSTVTTARSDAFLSTGNSETSSYEFRATLTDSFGKSSQSAVTISTSKVAFSINKDTGVGVGKVHERGSLDVGGRVYLDDVLNINKGGQVLTVESESLNGYGYMSWFGSDNNRKAYVGITNAHTNDFSISNQVGDTISLMAPKLLVDGTVAIESGTNGNGDWVKFYDGTMICRHITSAGSGLSGGFYGTGLFASTSKNWVYPATFVDVPATSVTEQGGLGSTWGGLGGVASGLRQTSFMIFTGRKHSNTPTVSLIAIGRWK